MSRCALLCCLLLFLAVPRLLAQPEIVGPGGGNPAAGPDVMKLPDVDVVLTLLTDPDANIRKKAALRLGQLKDPRAIQPLFNALADPQPAVGQNAIDALGMIGDSRAMPRLLNLLAQSEGIMRVHVADAVIALASPKSLNDLLNALRDATPETRRTLIRALGRINDPKAQQAVLAALEDADAGIRIQACWALCDFPSDAALDGLLRAARDPQQDVRLAAVRVLGAQGRNPEAPREVVTRATPVLVDVLRDPAWPLRQAAAEALQGVRDGRAVVPLLATLADADGEVQHAARETLLALDKDARDPLIAALREKAPAVRTEAARLLWRLNDPQAIPALITAAGDLELPVRQAAVEGLAWMRSRDARLLPVFLAAAKDPDLHLRTAAAQGVGKLDDPKALEALLALLADTDENVRAAAGEALLPRKLLASAAGPLAARLAAIVGDRDLSLLATPERARWEKPGDGFAVGMALKGMDKAAVDPLIGLLAHDRVEARIAAVVLLGQLGDAKAVDPLLKLLERERNLARWVAPALGALKAKAAVQPLSDAYKTANDPFERSTILAALAAIGDARALLALDDARHADDANLRVGAYTAIGALHHALSFTLLQEGLADQDPRVRKAALLAMGECGAKGVPVLAEELAKATDQGSRLELIKALVATKDPAALSVLLTFITTANDGWLTGQASQMVGSVYGVAVVPQVLEAFQQAYAKKGDDIWLKMNLYNLLAAIGAPAVPVIFDAMPKYEPLLTRMSPSAFERMGSVACPGLIDGLKHQNPKVRAWAARELRTAGDYRAVTPLLDVLRDPDASVRSAAAWSLASLAGPESIDALLVLCGDQDWSIRSSAAFALGYIGDPQAVAPLLVLLSDPDARVRENAVMALGNYTDPRCVEPLCAAIRGRESAGYYAANFFTRRLDPRCVEPLLATAWNVDQTVVRTGILALSYQADPRALAVLQAALKDNDRWIRQSALNGLALLGDKTAIDTLLAQLKDPDSNVSHPAAQVLGAANNPDAIEILLTLAGRDERGGLWTGINGLANCRDPRAIEPCLKALNGNYGRFVLGDAAKALAHFNTPQVREALLATARTGLFAGAQMAGPLADLGEARAVPILGQQLRYNHDANDDNDLERVATALGVLRDPRSIPDLISALDGGSQRSRAAAAKSLKLITNQNFGANPTAWQAWWEKQL